MFSLSLISAGVVEIAKVTEIVVHEEISVLNAPPDPSSSSIIRDDQNADTSEICDDKGYCESLKQVIYHRVLFFSWEL